MSQLMSCCIPQHPLTHCGVLVITVVASDTCMLILKLISSATVVVGKLRRCACVGTLQ